MKKGIALSFVLVSVLFAGETRLKESVITNTGFEEELIQSVKNTTVITKEDILSSGQTNVLDFLRLSPFVTIANGDRVDMRGQGNYANRSIQVLIDGISINSLDDSHRSTPLDILDMNDIEKIEIIPGGGAVLYGSSTRGGVINIITSKSSKKDKLSLGLLTGSYDLFKGRLNFGVNASENLFLMGNFQRLTRDGYRRGTHENSFFGDFGVRYSFLDYHSIMLSGAYSKIKRKDATTALSKEELKQDRRQSPIRKGQFGNTQFSYTKQDDRKFDLNYKYVKDNLLAQALVYYQDITMESFDDKKVGSKLKAKYSFEQGNLIGGYDFEKTKGKRGETNEVTKKSHSFYLSGHYNFTDVFGISLGDRFEFDDYKIFRTSKYDTVNHKTDQTNNAFEIVLNAKYDDDGNVYAKYERGFIAPSPYNRTDKVIVQGKGKYKLNDIKSETYDTFEIGFKDMIFGQFASANAYYTKSYDEIQIVWDMAGHAMAWHWENIAETERYGLEAFFEEYIGDNLSLNQSVDIIKAKITKGKNDGKKITYVPNFKGTFGVKYEPIKHLELFGNYIYTGKAKDNLYQKVPSYGVFNMSGRYTFYKNFSILAGVKNVFDKKYNNYQSSSMDRKSKKIVSMYDPAEERTFFLELSYNY